MSGSRLAVLLGICCVIVLSCFSDRNPMAEPPVSGDDCVVPGDAVGPNRTIVLIRNFRFLQDTIRVARGTRVTWVNCEAANIEAHTVTSTTGLWDSGVFAAGRAYSRTFDSSGTFPYFCIPHPTMRGVVIVH